MGTLLGALDIGSQNTTLLAGDYENGRLKIAGFATTPTAGVKKGIIRNIDHVVDCIKTVREKLDKTCGISLYDVFASFSSADVKAVQRRGRKSLLHGHAIDENDADEAIENAWPTEAADAAEIHLQRFQQQYEVDGKFVSSPLGMSGSELVANILELTAPRSSIETLTNALQRAGMHLHEAVFSGVAASEAVLDSEARAQGAIVIDIGAETCDLVAIHNGTMVTAGTLAVGGNHLSNDLAQAYQLSTKQADDIKHSRGAAVIQPDLAGERYSLRSPYIAGERAIPVLGIQTVVTERVDETFRILHERLAMLDALQHLHGNIYLTGGTAALPLIADKARDIFGMPCTVGTPLPVDCLPEEIAAESFRYATSIGLLRWGARILAQEPRSPGLFARLRAFLKG